MYQVVLGASLFTGYVYGLEKQQSLYVRAKSKVENEQKLVEHFQEEYRQDLLKQEAERRGEDVSVFNVPPGKSLQCVFVFLSFTHIYVGLRDMARTIKGTRSNNTATKEEEKH